MRVFRRGRHVRHRPLLRGVFLPVILLAGTLAGGSGFLAQSAGEVEASVVHQRRAFAPVADTRHLLAGLATSSPGPPRAAEIAGLDHAWREFEHTVGMRYALSPPAPDDHPPLPADSGEGRRIVYSNSGQRVWLVAADGSVLASHPVSGRRGVPRPGTYRVYSKSEIAWAGHDGITMQYMVRFARGTDLPIGFHSIPVDRRGHPLQTEEDLGSFRSAGCIRQAMADAVDLYRWADVGTTVVVTA